MKSWFNKRPVFLKAAAVLVVVLALGLLAVHTAFASNPSRQYQSQQDNSAQGYYCLAVLLICVPIAIWGRSKIRREASDAGPFNTTLHVAQPPAAIVNYINKNYDRSPKGDRDWSRKWFSKNPPKGQLSTWYPRYWSNCLFMILLGILPYIVIREYMGGRSEKILIEITPGEDGGSVVNLSSVGKVGYEEARYLADALKSLSR